MFGNVRLIIDCLKLFIQRGLERGIFVNRECIFLIAANRERKKLFPVIREITNLFLEIRENGL